MRAKAPLRISFAGGGTDVSPFPEREGGAVLSSTINRYAYAALGRRAGREVEVTSLDYGTRIKFGLDEPPAFDGNLDLPRAAISRLAHEQMDGFSLTLASNAPPGSGLGASSALVVAVVAAVQRNYGIPSTPYELADIAYQVERKDLGIAGGYQDQYAAAFGGFNFIEFGAEEVLVNPLRVDVETVRELEYRLVLVYTGKTRRSDGIIADQVRRYERGDDNSVAALRAQKEIAHRMKRALLRHELDLIGDLLHEAWEHKQQMSSKIATPLLLETYQTARAAGALGGKVTGAGGGGYMIFYCQDNHMNAVAEAMVKMGHLITDLSFTRNGAVTWRAA